MPSAPNNFWGSDFAAARERAKLESNRRFGIRVFNKIMSLMDVGSERISEIKYDYPEDTFGLSTFCEDYGFPVILYPKQFKPFKVTEFFYRMTKTEAWKALFNTLDAGVNPNKPIGVVWRVPGGKIWVMHTWWSIPEAPGYVTLLRPAKTDGRGIVVQTLGSLVVTARMKWRV